MPNIYHGEIVVTGADIVDDITAIEYLGGSTILIGIGAGAVKDLHIACFAAGVRNPLLVQAVYGAVKNVFAFCAGRFCAGIDRQISDSGIQFFHGVNLTGNQAVSRSTDSCFGGSTFLLRIGGVAVVVRGATGQEPGCGQVVVLIGIGRIGAGILGLFCPQCSIVIGQRIGIIGVVGICQSVAQVVFPEAFRGSTLAIKRLQIRLTIRVAIEFCVQFQRGNGAVKLSGLILGKGEASRIGGIGQCVGVFRIFLSSIHEIICPGATGIFIDDLLVQRQRGIQSKHGRIAAVVGIEGIYRVDVEIIQFRVA